MNTINQVIGVALLYNPVFPPIALTGRVAFFLVIASMTAFAASLFLLKPRLTPSVAAHGTNNPAASKNRLDEDLELMEVRV